MMLEKSTRKEYAKIKEVKVFKELLPNVYDYYKDDQQLIDECFYLDIETFLYKNLLSTNIELFTKRVKELAQKYDIENTAIDNDEIIIYPEYLLKYVYINMKRFETEYKESKGE